MKYTYCFPVETKVRGLAPRLYLSMKCLKNESTNKCIVGHKSGVHKRMEKVNGPFVYFAKGINPTKENVSFYKELKKSNSIIVYLDEEGGGSKIDNESFLMRYTDEALKYVDIICLWGKKQKKIIEKNKDGNYETFVTGHPRFDLKKPQFKPLHETDKECNHIPKDIVLFNLNFSYIGSYYDKQELFNHKKEIYERRTDNRYRKKFFEGMVNYEKKVWKIYKKAIKKVSKELECNVVVRPHPSSDPKFYQFNKNEGIVVSNRFEVQKWIIKSKAVIHHDCTTAIETFFSGREPISFLPVELENRTKIKRINRLPIEISKITRSTEGLINTLKNRGTDLISENKHCDKVKNLKKYISNIDFNSAERIDQIVKSKTIRKKTSSCEKKCRAFSLPSETDNAEKSILTRLQKLSVTQVLRKIVQKLNAVFVDNRNPDVDRVNAKFPNTEKKEITSSLTTMQDIENTRHNISVQSYRDNAFIIQLE